LLQRKEITVDLVHLKYNGRKVFKDKASKTSWAPGDTKPVTVDTARRLKKFIEFALAEPGEQVEAGDVHAALVLQNEISQEAKQEREQVEGVLLTIESMDKGALETYAAKYEVSLDRRKKTEDLRVQVAGLVEQFGAR
jgi:hypothetical protein